MTFYAIEWRYGRASNPDGTRCGNYYSFQDLSSRDKWVDAGNPYSTQAGARDPIPSSDTELRKLLRQQGRSHDLGSIKVVPIEFYQ